MELLFIFYKPLVRLINCKTVKNHPKKINVTLFGKYQIFLDQLKDSNQIDRNCVKTFDADTMANTKEHHKE